MSDWNCLWSHGWIISYIHPFLWEDVQLHFLELNMHFKVLLHFTYRIYPFSFISIVLLHNADQGQTMTHDPAVRSHAVFQCGAREKEQELECCRVWSAILLRQRNIDTRGCHGDAYEHASVFLPLWPHREFLLEFHCCFIAWFRISCLFLSTCFLWHFSSLPLFASFVIHPCNLFFQGLKIRITYSDLIGSVVQIYLCQYFHWPHHRKQLHCIFENSIYVSEWNTFVFLIRCLLVYKRKLQKVFVKGLRIILEMIQTLPC